LCKMDLLLRSLVLRCL
nr:immunoglobulin heavy chain junction region [Mus musculus]MBK4189725.1 immunoglobulin heavy chain junction region [Mus musculus]